MGTKRTAQAATDFMVSYGIAILIVAISLYIVLRVGVFSGQLAQPVCTPAPSFACGAVAIAANGLMTLSFTQAIGGQINITAVGCSTGINVTGNLPQYGNTKMQQYSVAPQYYPGTALQYGLKVYSDASALVSVYCYNGGGMATGNLGNTYTGYVWFNYTYNNLPSDYHSVVRVMQFSTKYS